MNKVKEAYTQVVLENIRNVGDIHTGQLPGYFFPKVMELGHLVIEPFSEDSLGNICYYLHFNNKFKKPLDLPTHDYNKVISLTSRKSIDEAFTKYSEAEKHTLMPGESVIAQTYEKVGVSEWFLSKLENTTSLGRVLLNHASHGYLHPGHGMNEEPFNLMIELTNLGRSPVELLPYQTAQKEGLKAPQAFRFYLEKLAYPAMEYKSVSSVPKLKMDAADKS